MVELVSVGKEIVSFCTPCKLALAHIVVTMKDEKTPGKVMCKTCKKTHAYKDPKATKKKTTKRATTEKKKLDLKKLTDDYWFKTISQSDSATHRNYSIRENFDQGDIIVHPKFGIGIVEKILDGNKIEVLFKSDEKILVSGK